MKKTISVFLVVCFILGLFSLTGCGAENITAEENTSIVLQIGNPIMTVNGAEQEIDPGRDTVPVIVDDRTLVPIRAIIEAMGGTVSWEEGTQTAILTYENSEIRLTIDSATAYFNDEAYSLDVAPTTINDRTMLPIRFVAERFAFDVDWNDAEQRITITKDTQESSQEPAATPEPEEPTESDSSRALVVYFSATGNTKALAETIAEAADADLAEIIPEEPYTSDDLNYNNNSCRANQELNSDARPAIQPLTADVAQYDVILLGYPIWWGQCPPVVRTFLEENDLSGKTIMPFCTSGSSGIGGSLEKIRQFCPESTVTEGFRGTTSTTNSQIATWLEENDFSQTTSIKMKLTTTMGDIIIKLNNSNAAQNLAAMLPLDLDFSDYNGTEKIAYPPEDIDVSDMAAGTAPKAGDLTIYAPWGNLALFYQDWSYSSSLIPLGSIESGAEWISALDGVVRAEVISNR